MFYAREPRRRPLLQLAPMIDVVFLLLIFFMVATTFPDDVGVEVEKPEAASAAPLLKDNLLFAITRDEKYYYSGKEITADEATRIIKTAVAGKPDVAVVVQIDRRAVTDALITFLDLARLAGASNLSIATKKK